jgi:hypothetical protein
VDDVFAVQVHHGASHVQCSVQHQQHVTLTICATAAAAAAHNPAVAVDSSNSGGTHEAITMPEALLLLLLAAVTTAESGSSTQYVACHAGSAQCASTCVPCIIQAVCAGAPILHTYACMQTDTARHAGS